MNVMRLQKYLARSGVASRRASEALISSGRVRVNGTVVTELGTKVDADQDTVTLDGQRVSIPAETVTLMLYKPAGYVTTMADPQGRPTVADLVPLDAYPGLFPVGRLDADTTGLLLFTTDGDLGNHLLHPRHHVMKRYIAQVKGYPTSQEIDSLRHGVMLDDGPTLPADVRVIEPPSSDDGRPGEGATLLLGLREGRKRQVRRMAEAIGHPVLSLHRCSFGPLELGSLQPGEWRLLLPEEVARLRESP